MSRLFLVLALTFTPILHSTTITAKSWLVADGNGVVIQSENSKSIRPIASITKLMTVMTVLDAHQDLDEQIGKYTRKELIQLALIRSDNTAAALLCNHYVGGREQCIHNMNTKNILLGMNNTHYIEPTGLSVFNISTAEDLTKLVIAASKYQEIRDAADSASVTIVNNRHNMVVHNTNPIIGRKYNFIVSKTGYISASGGCIALMVDTHIGRRIIVILGSKNTHTRIPEADFIAQNF